MGCQLDGKRKHRASDGVRGMTFPVKITEDDPAPLDADSEGWLRWNAVYTARMHLANMPAERRAMLEAEWSDEPRSCA